MQTMTCLSSKPQAPCWLVFWRVGASSVVGAGCGGVAGLPSLAARPRADRLQGRGADIQSITRKFAAVHGTTHSCYQPMQSTDITLC